MTRKAVLPLVLLAVVIGMWASPAQGAKQWSPLMLSTNGHDWVKKLDRPLFRHVTMVPGQTEVRTFYVRNRGDSKAHLSVHVKLRDKKDWVSSGDLRLAMGRTHHLQLVKKDRKVSGVVIPRGGAESFTVRIRYAPSATVKRHQEFSFNVKLRLTHSSGR